jgi:NADH-quinone oxidoreductase subunit L
MPTPALLLLIATLLPLASAALLLFVGKRMGTPLAGVVGTLFSGASMVASLAALATWLNVPPGGPYGAGQGPVLELVHWLPAGTGAALDVGVYVDSLTIAMFAMVTLVALLVHIFSLGYMRSDERFARFFTYLGLFCFSMLGLVIAGTLVQTFIFWELVGLCSYLLIGHWYERPSASNAAIKAFIMNRVGDAGLLVGIGMLFYHVGHTTLPLLWAQLGGAGLANPGDTISGFGYGSLTAAGLCLFLGAVGKSAQVPLHTWLADAMEGPTPVSALIHSATMVAAGVYLSARLFPLFTPDAKLIIAIVGVTTLTFGALVALAQTDIKRVLAYSTMSQLGYMVLAIGIGSWVGALFHLITHAFFKSLLFLGAGSVIHATHHEQDLRKFGGLYRALPITAIAFAVGVLAIAGTPLLSGYYSKSMILTHAAAFGLTAQENGRPWANWLLFILPTAVAYLTAFYMTRCWMLTFAGWARDLRVHAKANESWILYTPLLALAGMSILAGQNIGALDLINNSVDEARAFCQTLLPAGQTFTGFDTTWPEASPLQSARAAPTAPNAISDADTAVTETTSALRQRAAALEHAWAFWAFLAGIALAVAVYARGFMFTDRLLAAVPPLRWVTTVLANAFYIDHLYNAAFTRSTRALSTAAGLFDRYAIDGVVNAAGLITRGVATVSGLFDRFVVDGVVTTTATIAQDLGAAVRAPQTGRIRVYVTALLLLAVVAVAATVFGLSFSRYSGSGQPFP